MSLTLHEARRRAHDISAVSYRLDLDLTGAAATPLQDTYGCVTTVGFTCTAPSTFLELTSATDVTVTLDGVEVDAAYDGSRIMLEGLGGTHEVVVHARVPYVTDGDGLHRFRDPADEETYVSAYVGMDVAQRVFACFDQNDLKATYDLTVLAPAAWTVLANGRTASRESSAEGDRWSFTTTLPIPPAMFVVAAGPWHSHTWEHAGIPFGWHARRSLATELDRDLDELRRTTVACFDHYAELFDEPMPFDSYDQAFVPGQNWGALETPGCVTYRDEYLPRGRTTERMRAARATTIAHEMAHMWFGDLVTMTWWEDTWLQESFADYMGYRVAEAAAGYPDLLVTFESTRKSRGYLADARRSTHPVAPLAEDVPDVDAASGNFDMISYAKGNACLRQLVTWLGDETFLAGVNTYLSRHRLGNATLADFVAALDSVSDRDVVAWAEAWLRTTGFDTIRVARDASGTPVVHRDGTRPHRVTVTAYDAGLNPVETREVDLGDDPVSLSGWADRVVLPNVASETFARILLDDRSEQAVRDGLSTLGDPLTRAVLWGHLFDAVQTRELDAASYLDVVAAQLPAEPHPAIVTAVVARSHGQVLPSRVATERVEGFVAGLAEACRAGLADAATDEARLAWAEGLAATTDDVALLTRWLEDDAIDDLSLHPALRWRVVARLAALGAADAAAIEAERLRDGTVDGELGALRALAARPTAAAKADAWAAATEPDVSNRHFQALTEGLWSSEHPDLVAPYVERYFAEAPDLARRRGQAFSQIVGGAFPAMPLTTDQLADFERALTGDVPAVLRRSWEDRYDDLR